MIKKKFIDTPTICAVGNSFNNINMLKYIDTYVEIVST